MLKKQSFLLIALVAMVAFVTPVKAQMSDDAVISYVENGLTIGKSQDVLIKELAAQGVTKEQAERIKSRMEKQQSVSAAKVEEGTERIHASQAEALNKLDVPAVEAVKAAPTQVFGRNVFSIKSLTFAPSERLATPANYKLGPGDEVIVDIWGTNQTTIRKTITPDGFINVDGIGIVYLAGMTVKEADSYMRRQLGRIYSVEGEDAQSEIKLTLGAIRTITVNVMGEVVAPGTYSLSSLSNVYHALYRAGGFNGLSSVRNVSLVRNGKKIADIDVYDFIINGKPADDVVLQDGDVVLVPTYEAVVAVAGKVKRPMMYEMKAGENLEDLIAFAGGFTGDAYTANVNVERRNGREYQVYTVDNSQFPTFALVDGDKVEVGTIIDRYENRLEVKGAVYRPGFYQLNDKVNTVAKLIAVADGLRGDALTNRALLHREREDYTLELIQVDLKGILNGSVADIPLQKNDVLTVLSANEIKDLGFVTIVGEVANPGDYRFAENTGIEDLILQAGGLLESASTVRIDVSRRIKNPESVEDAVELSEWFSFNIDKEYNIDGDEDFVLQPYDHVYVRRSPGYSAQDHVFVQGEVIFPGTYALKDKAMRLSDVVKLAGGVSSMAYVKGAKLNRRMNMAERAQLEAALGMLGNSKDSTSVDKLNAASVYSVGIDLEEALSNPGGDADVVLRKGDIISVPEYVNTVKVSGCVLFPNVVTYNHKMSVSDYIEQAGGFGFGAKKNRAYVVYMNGSVAKARKLGRDVIQPGCEIIVPEKRKKEGTLQNALSLASTSASIATMFGTLYNIIR